jgi:glycosyltransferase involved in cell wall biosynthesis
MNTIDCSPHSEFSDLKDLKTIAILCAYNLEKTIGEVVKQTSKYVDKVIVVADGSTDKTAKNAEKNGAIVPLPTLKRGKGYAIIKGIEKSKEFSPDIVILMDADGQHKPQEIPIVVEPILNGGFDMVVGSRMLGELKTSFINKIGNFGLKLISFMVTRKWMTDTESGFRAFDAKKIYSLNLTSIGFEIESELLLKSIHNNFKIKEVPITVPCQVPGITVIDGIKNGWYKFHKGLELAFKSNK